MESQSKDAVYRLNLETRVIAMLVFLGYFILVTVVYFTMSRPDQFEWGAAIVGAAVVTLAYNYLARWRLIITAQGITRRRYLLGADHWPWEDFASGKIQKVYPMKLVGRQRPFWRRTINLAWLTDKDADTVMQVLNWHYKPAELELPDEVEFKYGFGWVITLTKQGIRVKVRSKVREYAWSDVERIRVLRLDTVRQDFANLDIFLPGEKIHLSVTLVNNTPSRSWVGAKAEEINEYLRHYVPTERWKEQVAGDEITEMEDLEEELAGRRQYVQVAWVICGGYLIAYALFAAWVTANGAASTKEYVVKGFFMAIAVVLILIHAIYQHHQMRRYVEEARQEAQHDSLHV